MIIHFNPLSVPLNNRLQIQRFYKETRCMEFWHYKFVCKIIKCLGKVRKAPYSFPWFVIFFFFFQVSAMVKKQSWVLHPFQNPHWNFKKDCFRVVRGLAIVGFFKPWLLFMNCYNISWFKNRRKNPTDDRLIVQKLFRYKNCK